METTVALPWFSVWAKTDRSPAGLTKWLPLHQHLADSAGVAGRLVDEWVSPQVVRRIARDLGGDGSAVRSLAAWSAAVHDLGKASPAFVAQELELAAVADRHGLPVAATVQKDPERGAVNHALVGHVVLRDWLYDERGVAMTTANQLAGVVGSHHGVPPESAHLRKVYEREDLAGTGPWVEARRSILEWSLALVDDDVATRCPGLSLPSQVLLTGVVIMADWIASNAELFPLDPLHTADAEPAAPDAVHTRHRLDHGWDLLDLPSRWQAVPTDVGVDALIAHRFGKAAARPVQRAAVDAARVESSPGLTIVEAPMGEGKTEAALLAAEALAARTGADGCFVALPTRATSDAMFGRVVDWVEALPDRDGHVTLTLTLAHGTAGLNETFRGLVQRGRPTSLGVDLADDAVLAHAWLRGRKKGVLAQFVVGTIDQVLFAGLKSRHLMLRHLGLAGKVVVIDEVHAYDVYMSEYLERVLHWLGAYGVPVVLLSATLPSARRTALVAAYDSGAGTTSADVGAAPYPTVVTSGGAEPVGVVAGSRSTTVALTRLDDDLDALVALLSDRLEGGGCAVVVRNTVARVQETAERLSSVFGDDAVTIDHSRFLACDRARIDLDLLRRFGPDAGERPPLHVVVASQVVEQSLDVDFDLMVTDLAPVDLLLQRMGRLHRHPRERPGRVSHAECVVVGVEDWAAQPVRAVPGSRRVYEEDALLRCAALIVDREHIVLPADIAPLVQAAYGDLPLGPPEWQDAMATARRAAQERAVERRARADEFRLGRADGTTLVGWVKAGTGDADDDPRGVAQVRDGAETLEVLVACRDAEGGLTTPPWLPVHGGESISFDFEPSPDVARALAVSALRLPLALSHPGVIDAVIKELEQTYVPGLQLSPMLKERLLLVLDEERQATLRAGDANYRLTYDLRRGLLHERA